MKKNNLKSIAAQLGSQGGKKSVKSRFKGKTKAEISEMMRGVRLNKITYTKQDHKRMDKMAKEIVKNLNKNTK